MIRQSGVNPAGMAIDPQPVTTPTTEPEGRWRGWEVIQTGASAFIRSLHPLYDPLNSHRHLPVQDVADSAAGIDLWGVVGQNNNFHQFTALAGRAIAAYSGLPPEINSLLSYLANLAAVGRFASDQLNAFSACGGSIPEPGTHREKTPDETLENTKGKTRKASQNLRHQYDKSAAPTLPASQLPNTPLALGALVGLSAVGAASASASDRWINVADAENLGKICRDKGSCSKQYRLTDDFNDNQLSRSIGSKKNPFTGKLDGNYRTIGKLSKCLVKHLSAEGRIENLTLSDAKITSTDPAGVVACEMSDNAKISNIRVERANVTTNKEDAYAAIGVGIVNGGGTITNMTALDCSVETSGESGSAGIGAGSLKSGAVNNMVAVNCDVTTKGEAATAGIGAGFSNQGIVNHTTAVDCRVETTERGAYAGIGVGVQRKGKVTDTTALNCTVKTKGYSAYAGIGAGSSEEVSTVNHTTAVNCHVVTEGGMANAGIGIGSFDSGWSGNENITNTKVFNSSVTTSKYADGSISGGDNPFICNVTVGGELKRPDKGCQYWRDNDICEIIAPDLAKLKLQIDNYCPGTSITETTATTPGSTMNSSNSGSVTTTTSPTTRPKVQKTNFSGPDPATFAAPTPPVASPSPAVIACIATLGTVIIVLAGVIAYRYYSQRSSTNAGRNRAEPMPPPASGRPRAEGQLPTPPRDHYQPLS
ncbi:ZmpA/ZmpB/ZmpC family metallo-endopeptidase-related protein, partial [Endozoicomonas acroporae]